MLSPLAQAAPRSPLPPWPQQSLTIYGWDSLYWQGPIRAVALGEDSASYAESWSGYSLMRDGLTTVAPVAIPVAGTGAELNVASAYGAVRFWLAPNWTSVNEKGDGSGPGHYARLLELVNWGGKAPETRWSLYVNESGDTIYFSGQGAKGPTDFLKAPIAFQADGWSLVTVCYSETNSALWLNDQLVVTGEGVAALAAGDEKTSGLVVGSDLAAANTAEAQFEELTTFDYWPDAAQQAFYFKAIRRHAMLGPVGTEEEEQAKQAMLKEVLKMDGVVEKDGEGNGPLNAYTYPSTNGLWLQITGVSNGLAYIIVHGTFPDSVYEILSKEALTNSVWQSEGVVFGAADQDWTLTTVPVGTRTNALFIWARTWVDSDGGGLPDWWQLENFGHLGVDPYGDPDGDGWSNIEEYQNGTNPNLFSTPPAPREFAVHINTAGTSATLSWATASPSPSTYIVERDWNFDQVFFTNTSPSLVDSTVSLPSGSYWDWQTPRYRVAARYAAGDSAWGRWLYPEECLNDVEAQVLSRPDGTGIIHASPVPNYTASLRFSQTFVIPSTGEIVTTNFTIIAGNFASGTADLPNWVQNYPWTLTSGWFVQVVRSNGFATMKNYAGTGLQYLARPLVDGRRQLLENLRFVLRAASVTTRFEFYDDVSFRGLPQNYVAADYHVLNEVPGDPPHAAITPWAPFDDNHMYQNMVFAVGNIASDGWLNTGFYIDPSGDFALDSLRAYEFQSNGIYGTYSPVLATNDTRWLHPGWEPFDLGIGYSSSAYQMTNNMRNYYGLPLLSAKVVWAAGQNPVQMTNLYAGYSVADLDGSVDRYFYPEAEQPVFQSSDYYFGRLNMHPLPGHQSFSPTNTTPLIVASVGEAIEIGGYLKLGLLNGYSDKGAYVAQYFDRSFAVATNGTVTTNTTGYLSPYGEFFPTEPGRAALITLPMETNSTQRGTCIVHAVSINVDGNHDGTMDFSYLGPDQTTANHPYRFWVNDDDDAKETKGDDIPGQSQAADYRDTIAEGTGEVDGVRDLVDFFPVYLNMAGLLRALPTNGSVTCWLKQEDSALNYVDPSWYWDSNFGPTNCLTYLTDTNVAAEIARVNLPSARTIRITGTGAFMGNDFVAKIRNEGKAMLLLEARGPTTKPLVLELRQGTNVVAQTQLYLSITNVEQMFRQKNLIREESGNTNVGFADRLLDASVPNEPETNGKNFVFLHGYNVNPNSARGAFAEMFKRMYWSRSHAKFYGVTWRGYQGQIGPVTPSLQTNVVTAFLTAPKLKDFLATLTNDTVVAAHSLGNMVTLSALSDWNANLSKFFMIDAAVAIEAIDGSASWSTNMVHPDWSSYANRLYASRWFNLFTSTDYRSTLTWSNRLSNLPLTNIYNFYSSGEEVLREHVGTPPVITAALFDQGVLNGIFGVNPVGTYTWAWQEKLKGGTPGDWILGSSHGGWKFNSTYDTNSAHLPPAQAALLPDSQLRTNAFFNVASGVFTADNALLGSSGSAYAQANRNRILADAIPALTLPAGANVVTNLDVQAGEQRNFNMQTAFKNGWPSDRTSDQSRWHHSDFREVAYTYIYKLFDEIVNDGNLK